MAVNWTESRIEAYHSNGLERALQVALDCTCQVSGVICNWLALISHTPHLHTSILLKSLREI